MKDLVSDFISLDLEHLRSKYQIKDGASWKLIKAKQDVIENKALNKVLPISYRPFDSRFTLFTQKSGGFLNRPIYDVMQHMQKSNLALLCKRQSKRRFSYIFVSNLICESCVFESAYANNSVLPLYIYADGDSKQTELLGTSKKRANLDSNFIKEFEEKLTLKCVSVGRGDLQKTFGPEDVFYYSYAVFHSPAYRSRYAEQLKIDFPRLPLTGDKKLFAQLVALGNELVNLHLLGENPFDQSFDLFDEKNQNKWGIKIGGNKSTNLPDWQVTDVRYNEKDKRIFVNKSQYFEGVEKEVWGFMIGGYQVCEKWLKDRKKAERTLSIDDLRHYMKMVVAMRETIRLMSEIDKAIPSWPIK
jgi:predicted helicase